MDSTKAEPRGGRQHRESHRLKIKLTLQERGLENMLRKVEERKVAIEATTTQLTSAVAAERKFAQGSAGR